jgi:hypothetical protein
MVSLRVEQNNIGELNHLNPTLQQLIVYGLQLTELPELPKTLTVLLCFNVLTGVA